MDKKQFTRMLTRMFSRSNMLRNISNAVSDGFIIYRGELRDDIFYRLRLEANGQQEMFEKDTNPFFDEAAASTDVDLKLVYTLPNSVDVFEVGNEIKKPYIAFSSRFRRLFQGLDQATYRMKYTSEAELETPSLQSPVLIMHEHGDVIVMPMILGIEEIYR